MPNAISHMYEYLGYKIYFWSNENKPLEPIHVHICRGKPKLKSTKYWIKLDGSVLLANNAGKIPQKDLRNIEKLLKQYHKDIIYHWEQYFGESAKFYNSNN